MSRIEELGFEPMTQAAWTSLFQRAQEAVVPYYLIAETILGPNIQDKRLYDGISFRSAIAGDPNLIDPATSKTIRKVHYYVLQCFEVDLDAPTLRRCLSFERAFESMFKVPENYSKDPIAAEALNFFSAENPASSVLVRKCQYIMGMRFRQIEALNPKENIRWLIAAAVHLGEAQEALDNILHLQKISSFEFA